MNDKKKTFIMEMKNVNLIVKKCDSNKIWKTAKCRCKCKIPRKDVWKKGYIWNIATCSSENGRYAGSIIDDLTI